MLRFNKTYFLLTILLFCTEVFIALFVHDNFIRPYFGDVLVVILIYCFIQTFFNLSKTKTAIYVLLFAFLIETLQYFNFITFLGLEKNKVAKTVIGNSFSFHDLLAYVVGILITLGIEKIVSKKKETLQ